MNVGWAHCRCAVWQLFPIDKRNPTDQCGWDSVELYCAEPLIRLHANIHSSSAQEMKHSNTESVTLWQQGMWTVTNDMQLNEMCYVSSSRLKAWFQKVNQLEHVSVLVDLFAVQPVRSQNHVWLRNVNVNKSDVTLFTNRRCSERRQQVIKSVLAVDWTSCTIHKYIKLKDYSVSVCWMLSIKCVIDNYRFRLATDPGSL